VIDHLVYAVPDVGGASDDLERDWGMRPAPGGRHTRRGTHNALLDLGDERYLEIIGPDPEQPEPPVPRPFGIDRLVVPRLVTWAAKAPGIEDRVAEARRRGFDPGPVAAMSRTRPDGRRLDWRLTTLDRPGRDGLVPFLIDWGTTPHPAAALPGCRLAGLRAEHAHPELIAPLLSALDLDLDLEV
jgi:hypothetical protein